MSTDPPAIHVSHLSKQYRLGGPQEPYRTLRDSLVNSLKSPLKVFHKVPPPDGFWALKDVSFEVEPGEVIGIVGRNGAGKSTLLKILSRITSPTEGTVELHGRVGSLLEVGTGFHPELTGRENIYLSGSILGMKRREIDAKLDDIVKFSEIEKFLDTPVKRYSSGMYVRLAFAVAAHLEPEILLVDEVLAVGDAAFQKKCLGKMGDVAKEGRTVVFVSHNMNAVINLTHRCLWIDKGTIKMQGPSTEIVTKYLEEGYQKVTSWTAAKQNANPIQILGAEISSSKDFFDVTADLVISIRYIVRREVHGSVISAIIHASDGAPILSTEDIDLNPDLFENREPGTYTSSVTIPGNWLSSGKYYLRLHSGIVYQAVFDNIEALSFELIETGNSKIRQHKQAYLLPYLPWVK
ncbi:MAG: ABC transporter ATP-binding protein [Methanoregula sp.]|nr:ABC transporter ATP-binding protein [Methanoregula sp.]